MQTLLIEMQYLAPLNYYALLQGYDKVVIWRKVYDLFKVDVKVYDFL